VLFCCSTARSAPVCDRRDADAGTPLILTGLAAAVAFRAHFYNIGAEGQLYLGALAAVAIGGGAIAAPPCSCFRL
jgi:ABC-type uncharacterized transport system permease subunit